MAKKKVKYDSASQAQEWLIRHYSKEVAVLGKAITIKAPIGHKGLAAIDYMKNHCGYFLMIDKSVPSVSTDMKVEA